MKDAEQTLVSVTERMRWVMNAHTVATFRPIESYRTEPAQGAGMSGGRKLRTRMSRYILKLEDHYLEWETMVDAPGTFGMSLEEFTEYYRDEYGRRSMDFEFKSRMKRVEEKGNSSQLGHTVDELLAHNRAGKNETCLTKEQIIQYYINDKDPKAERPVGTSLWGDDE